MKNKWYIMDAEEVVKKLDSDIESGLSTREANNRLGYFGVNCIMGGTKISPWTIFVNQFKDFMMLILIVSTFISGFLHEWADAVTIMVIIVINAFTGFVQEYRAEKSMQAFKKLTAPEAKVLRDGAEVRVSADRLVPGDIVLLETGDRIPADLRLLETVNMEVEESTLTGESIPVKKQADKKIEREDVALGDVSNIAYMGTLITRGRGKGIVVSTGMSTEMGQIADMIQQTNGEQTPLQERLSQLKALVFCNNSKLFRKKTGVFRSEWDITGDPTEGALLVAAVKAGMSKEQLERYEKRIAEIPFDSERKRMTVVCVDKKGNKTAYVKGATDVILKLCDSC